MSNKNNDGTLAGFSALGAKGVQYKQDGNYLIVAIDTTKDFGPSESGKTTIIASTEGNQNVLGLKLGLNAYVKRAKS